MREDAAEKEGLIEYNYEVLKKAILDVFAVQRSVQRSGGNSNDAGRSANMDDGSFERDDDYSRGSSPNQHDATLQHVIAAKNAYQNSRMLISPNHTVN